MYAAFGIAIFRERPDYDDKACNKPPLTPSLPLLGQNTTQQRQPGYATDFQYPRVLVPWRGKARAMHSIGFTGIFFLAFWLNIITPMVVFGGCETSPSGKLVCTDTMVWQSPELGPHRLPEEEHFLRRGLTLRDVEERPQLFGRPITDRGTARGSSEWKRYSTNKKRQQCRWVAVDEFVHVDDSNQSLSAVGRNEVGPKNQ